MEQPLIHPTAVIDPAAELDSSVEGGPSAVIGQINENIARLQELAVLIRAEKEQNPPVLY